MLAPALALLLAAAPAAEPLAISLEGFAYPFPVQMLPLTIEGQDLRMAYMLSLIHISEPTRPY